MTVTVTTPGGTSASVPADQYDYVGPSVTAITPPGPRSRDTKVTITGTGLKGATGVLFGTVAGTGMTVNGAGTKITVTSRPTPRGRGHHVTAPGATSATVTADR